MKRPLAYVFFLFVLAGLGFSAKAQVRVTGHVFAEIVEAASTASNMSNELCLRIGHQTTDIAIGEITLSGGSLQAGAVLISSSNLSGENGTEIEFIAATYQQTNCYSLDASGSQRFRLTGSTGKKIYQGADKILSAGYAIVFAYN